MKTLKTKLSKKWPAFYIGYENEGEPVIFLLQNAEDHGICIYSSDTEDDYKIGEPCAGHPVTLKAYHRLTKPLQIKFVPCPVRFHSAHSIS
jgi:hypothetical protein